MAKEGGLFGRVINICTTKCSQEHIFGLSVRLNYAFLRMQTKNVFITACDVWAQEKLLLFLLAVVEQNDGQFYYSTTIVVFYLSESSSNLVER